MFPTPDNSTSVSSSNDNSSVSPSSSNTVIANNAEIISAKSTTLTAATPHKHERFNLFTLLFMGFMLLVGIGIVVTQFSGATHGSSSNPTSAAYSGSKTSTTKTPGLGFSIPNTPTPEPQIKIYVTGEVNTPGVYLMVKEDRISDAIDAAGGLTDAADVSQLDLAQRVRDEMRLNITKIVPTSVVSPNLTTLATNTALSNVATKGVPNVSLPGTPVVPSLGPATAQSSSKSGKIGPDSGVKINVNTADASELQRLPGVGATLSQRLIEYRSQHGSFQSLDDLRHVQGMTKTLVDKLKDLVVFS